MLELDAVAKTYDDFEFGPVDLRVADEVLTVLGPSGSGKTTLLSLVAGLVEPDAGTVRLDGRSLVGRPLEARRVGLVFQDGALFPHMTARENVAYALDSHAGPGSDDSDAGGTGARGDAHAEAGPAEGGTGDRVTDLAAMLEVEDVLDRRPAALSGGEKQRVALARTLAADPDALLLDEPLTSLDVPVRRRLRDELRDLFADLAVPVVYVTHDQRAATALGDRVAVLRDGAFEQVGTPGDVIGRPATRFVAEFTGSANVLSASVSARDGDVATLRVGDLALRATVTPAPDGQSDAAADASASGTTRAPVGATVTACVLPSRLGLTDASPPDAAVGDPATARENGGPPLVAGTVRRWTNEGDAYRVVVDADDADVALTASVRPGTFEGLSLGTGTAVRVAVPPEHVHLIG